MRFPGLPGLPGLFEIPIFRIPRVHHVGQIDAAGATKGSLEAHCLSVSNCPMAWRQIARLGDRPLHQLSKDDGTFLDVIRCLETPEIRLAIENYGINAGYAQRSTLYRAWSYDSEDESWRFSLHKTENEAFTESDSGGRYETSTEVLGPDENTPGIESVQVLTGAMDLQLRTRQFSLESHDVLDLIAICWTEDCLHQVDGVWWAETYSPESLSAPRGGILPSRLQRWTSTALSIFPDDDIQSPASYSLPAIVLQADEASPKARKRSKP